MLIKGVMPIPPAKKTRGCSIFSGKRKLPVIISISTLLPIGSSWSDFLKAESRRRVVKLNVPFWEGRDLKTFAKFIKIASEEAWSIRPGLNIVVGALVKQENINELVPYLRQEGVDLNRVIFAIHAYHTPQEVENRVQMVKGATGGARVLFSEFGVSNSEDSDYLGRLVQMYSKIRQYSEEPAIIHQLALYPDAVTGEQFGFVDLADSILTDDFFKVQQGIAAAESNR